MLNPFEAKTQAIVLHILFVNSCEKFSVLLLLYPETNDIFLVLYCIKLEIKSINAIIKQKKDIIYFFTPILVLDATARYTKTAAAPLVTTPAFFQSVMCYNICYTNE